MSDTIEATVTTGVAEPVPDAPGAPIAAEDHGRYNARIDAQDLIRLAQGFYYVFWGLLIAVLTATQLLIADQQRALADLFLAAAVIATLVGTWRLNQTMSAGELWKARTRSLLGLAVLLVYFCAIFYMWRRVPGESYLLANALAFLATGIVYILQFSRAVAALAVALGRKELLIESRLFSAGTVGFLLLPFFSALLYCVTRVIARGSDLATEFQMLLSRSNMLLVILLLLPFSLTLSLAWAAKDAALRQLAGPDSGKKAEPARR
jgi:cellulose synthase/poly-beta-1,6-N-acetylglucosamine synthase-like glycosyltransferase